MALDWKIFTQRPYIKSLPLEEQVRLFNIANEKSIRLREQRFIDFANSNSTSQGASGDGNTGTGPVLLLDIAGATDNLLSAVSFRKLSSTYSGNCCKVWRNSDSAELDIGFTSEGYVDIDAIETFSGGSERVYILTWYDQNGSNNLTSTKTTTNSPSITNASGNILKNGNFVFIDDGGRNVVSSPAVIQPAETSATVIGIWDTDVSSNRWNWVILGNAGSEEMSSFTNSNGTVRFRVNAGGGGQIVTSALASTGIVLQSFIANQTPGTTSAFINGTLGGSSTLIDISDSWRTLQMPDAGSSNNANNPMEVVWYNDDKSTIREAMESNINTYYSIY